MSQPTGQSYHVHGPAVIYTGTGSAGAGETFGISEDGVAIEEQKVDEPVKSDAAGGVPAEFQDMGQFMVIRFRVVAYDDAVLQHILSRGDRTSAGLGNTPGTLIHTNSYGFKLGIRGSGTNVDDPWYFPTVSRATGRPAGTKLGSRYTAWDMELTAIRFVPGTATTAKDVVLWARAFPGGFPS